MSNPTKPVAASNAARIPTRTVGNNNQQPADVQSMSAGQRNVLMAELMHAQQAEVAPLEEQKRDLQAQLDEINKQISELRPDNSPLAVYRAVYAAVKAGNNSLEDIVQAAGHDAATVEAMLKKHLLRKDGKDPIFTFEDDEYRLTPKDKKKKKA